MHISSLSGTSVAENDASQWARFLTDFPGAYKAFQDNRAGLTSIAAYVQRHPELQASYSALVARSNALQPKLAELKSVYDNVSGFFKGAGKVYGTAVDATSRAIESVANTIASARKALGLGELGIAPIIVAIGAGVALATLSALVAWVTDTYKFSKRVNTMMELEQRGYSPEQAAALVNNVLGKPPADKGGLSETVNQIAWIAGLGLLAVFFGPMIRDALASGKR